MHSICKNLNMKKIILAIVFTLGLTSCASAEDHLNMVSEKFDGAAVMFAQMMIPHHEQAVELSQVALEVSKNAEVKALANEIIAAQNPEIAQMQSWLDAVGMPDMHHAMEMPGFVSDQQYAELKELSGTAFDLKFLELMIAHHEGAIEMAQDIFNNKTAEVKKLSREVIDAQTAEIEFMQNLIAQLS